jgi:glycosidase
MQWSDADFAGFSTAEPWRPVHENYLEVNVAAQEDNPDSLLSHYQELITLRKEYPALGEEGIIILDTGTTKVFAALRHHQDEALLVLINLGDEPVSDYSISGEEISLEDGTYDLEILLGDGETQSATISSGRLSEFQPVPELPPFSTLIMKLR